MIGITSDHRGFELKKSIIDYLEKNNIEVSDLGTYTPESVDYPTYALNLARQVRDGDFKFGIAICGTGIGMTIAANKVKGVYAALCNNLEDVRLARTHNNANILALSARTNFEEAKEMALNFISTEFVGHDRHEKRIDIIKEYENKVYK